MEELKKFTGQSMNLDKNDKTLLPTETREVYNSITDRKGVFTRFEGNTLVNFTLPAGVNEVIGSCNDYSRSAIIYFVKNSLGNHCILRVRGQKIDAVLLSQPVLNFKGRINHANTIGDLLYWTDGFFESFANANPPRKINMVRAIGSLNPYTAQVYQRFDVVNSDGKVYEFIGETPGVFPLTDRDNWAVKGRIYDNMTTERLYWILDRIKYPRSAEAPVVYYSDNVPAVDPPVIIDPPTTIPYGFLYNWDALFDVVADTFKYGFLYNFHAVVDARLITSSDEWEIQEQSDYGSLITYLTSALAGQKLKESGTLNWNTPNSGTNEVLFNGRGAGERGADGTFGLLKQESKYYTISLSTDRPITYRLKYNDNFLTFGIQDLKTNGNSIRPFKTSTSLTHGQSGIYIGNDLKVYRTICINGVEYLADNLAETKFRDGSWIPGFDGGVYTPISNAAWAALTTAALCAYEDNLANV